MSDTSAIVDEPAARARNERHVDAFIALVVATALAGVALTALLELSAGISPDINWPLYGLIAVLLLAGETTTSKFMRMSNGGLVTMGWTFAFSLALLGSPTGAVAVLATATLLAEIKSRHDIRRVVFNTAQVALSLAFGGLTLFAFGIHGPITGDGSIPLKAGLAILCSALVVFITNGVTVCYVISVSRGERLIRTMRNGFAVSMAADGALLALAPIFLVSIEFSVMMVPMLVIAALIVYQSAVQAIERAHEANHDPLTELRNRRSFVAETDQFLSDRPTGDPAMVLLIDLDGFKGINDRLGHQVGDHVLRSIASRLTGAIPKTAIAARLGGDEFAVFIPSESNGSLIDLNEIHACLVEPMTIDGVPIAVGASIGAASCPDHGETSGELLHAADIAMYRAKQFQTGVEHHDSSSPANRGRRSLLRSLSEAMGSDQFSIRFEPLVHLRDFSIGSVEAHLCWTHPTLGEIASSEFLRLAEPTDLIGPLTEAAIEQSVRDLAALDDHQMVLSIQVPAGVLPRAQFAKRTLSMLHRLRLAPSRLELAITEHSLESDPARSRAALTELRAAGVRIAIADFGTNHSSYLTLRDLTVDRIKIAETFVQEMRRRDEDVVIVQSVIDLAHGFGIDVVAVGLDSEVDWARLATMGCDIAQGARVAPAMGIDELVQWVQASRDPLRSQALDPSPLTR